MKRLPVLSKILSKLLLLVLLSTLGVGCTLFFSGLDQLPKLDQLLKNMEFDIFSGDQRFFDDLDFVGTARHGKVITTLPFNSASTAALALTLSAACGQVLLDETCTLGAEDIPQNLPQLLPGIMGEDHTVGDKVIDHEFADLNNDGFIDLAVLNRVQLSENVAVLLGNSDTTFDDPVNFPAGDDSRKIQVADFNQDGNVDVITSNARDITVLFGDGQGALGAPVTIHGGQVSQIVQGMVTGDFNEDGAPDVISTLSDSGQMTTSILTGKGDGTFNPPAMINKSSETGAPQLTVDVNGDDHLDLVASNSVVLGQGDGSFLAEQVFESAIVFNVSIKSDDLNGDGKLDLVGVSSQENLVSVYIGNGDGTFETANRYVVAQDSSLLVLFDFDGDGDLDILPSGTELNHLSLLLGNGDGTFIGAPAYISGLPGKSRPTPNSVVISDFDQDGIQDLVVGHAFDNTTMLQGKIASGFELPIVLGEKGEVNGADFNQDGLIDLINTDAGKMTVSLSNGDGTFNTLPDVVLPAAGSVQSIRDFNNDGKSDVLVITAAQAQVYLGKGDGTFQNALNVTAGVKLSRAQADDFNDDGKLDLAITDAGDFGMLDGELKILLGNGDGTFTAANSLLGATGLVGVSSGDFDGDGNVDVATLYESPQFQWNLAVLTGNGNGTFGVAVNQPVSADFFFPGSSMLVVDFDGDGNTDILAFVDNTQLGAWLGNGDGSLQVPILFDASGASNLTQADVNLDGRLDLIVANGEAAVALLIKNDTIPTATTSGGAANNGDGSDSASAGSGGANTSNSKSGGGSLDLPMLLIISILLLWRLHKQ